MKRWIAALMSVLMMLALAACASAPETTVPQDAYDLAYNMADYDWFSDIFEEKTSEEWDAMGAYTILLEGLDTPVLVDMSGRDVVAVHAYDQTAELGDAGTTYQDETPVSIRSAGNVVVVNISWDHDGETILLTQGKSYTFQPDGDISTQIYVGEDGVLAYGRYWGEYVTSFDQWETAPLELSTSREQFLYETGHAEIVDGEVVLTPEKTVTLADVYDLDALFAEAKANGFFEEYETVDALLAANQS